MFAGVIEAVGIVSQIVVCGPGAQIEIYAPDFGRDMAIGDAVAVDGEKLAIAQFARGSFAADITSDAHDHTTLGELTTGQKVNLERGLRVSDRVGGHTLTGITDGIGILEQRNASGNTLSYTFRVPLALAQYLIENGPIAINGVSLNITRLDRDLVTCLLVPAIAEQTTLQDLSLDAPVNIEVDLVAKYLYKFAQERA
ncbi:MAG: riboflavin synthase [Coriobacteriia bacterium]|nr:riboflavin synthase [Coriobacteriia bacterium]